MGLYPPGPTTVAECLACGDHYRPVDPHVCQQLLNLFDRCDSCGEPLDRAARRIRHHDCPPPPLPAVARRILDTHRKAHR